MNTITWSKVPDLDVFAPSLLATFPNNIVMLHADEDCLYVLLDDGNWYKMRLP